MEWCGREGEDGRRGVIGMGMDWSGEISKKRCDWYTQRLGGEGEGREVERCLRD